MLLYSVRVYVRALVVKMSRLWATTCQDVSSLGRGALISVCGAQTVLYEPLMECVFLYSVHVYEYKIQKH